MNGKLLRLRIAVVFLMTIMISVAVPMLNNEIDVYAGSANDFVNDARWKDGISWGGDQHPKLSGWSSTGCCAYAADFAKYCYNAGSPSSGTPFYNPSEIRDGDIIYITGHWFVVLSRSGNSLYTAEGNFSGRVRVSGSVYTVSGNQLNDVYNGVRNMEVGYHYQSGNTDPIGTLDVGEPGSKPGTIHVRGWAFDPDSPSTSIDVHVYVGAPAGSGGEGHSIPANQLRSDVNSYYGISGNHGFDVTFDTNKTGTQTIYVYAINAQTGNNPQIGSKSVTIAQDTAKPTVTDIKVTKINSKGYTISCKATDSGSGVNRVQFPTWTDANGQDDIASNWTTNTAVSGTKDGDTYTFRVNIADHNNERGTYYTDIYAWDNKGNETGRVVHKIIVVPEPDTDPPVISNVEVVSQGGKQAVIEADVTDNVGIDREGFSASVRLLRANGKIASVNGLTCDITWPSETKVRITIDTKDIFTEKAMLYLTARDMDENVSETKEQVFLSGSTKTICLKPGDTMSETDFSTQNPASNSYAWRDSSWYGDSEDPVLRKNDDGTFTAIKEGRATLLFRRKTNSTATGCEVIVRNNDTEPPIISNVSVISQGGRQTVIEADVTDNVGIDREGFSASVRLLRANGKVASVNGLTYDTTWSSETKVRITIDTKDIFTEKAMLYLTARDMDGNVSETKEQEFLSGSAKIIHLDPGDTMSEADFSTQNPASNSYAWRDSSWYGDSEDPVLRKNDDGTFTAIKEGRATLLFRRKTNSTATGCEVIIGDPDPTSTPTPEPTDNEEDITDAGKSPENAVSDDNKDQNEKDAEPSPEPAAPGSNPNQKGKDGTAVGEGASAAAADKAITGMKSDTDLPGAAFSKLKLRSPKQTSKSITLKWTKVGKAAKYVIYANKCGKTTKPRKVATVTGSTKTFKKVAGKKLRKGTYYKFIIVALDRDNNVVSTSKLIHVATKGGKVGNCKNVTVRKYVITKAKKLKKGKTLKIKAKTVDQSMTLKAKKHVGMRYESTNAKVATVSKSGTIKARKKGTCYVYAYAQNGVLKKIKVVVR